MSPRHREIKGTIFVKLFDEDIEIHGSTIDVFFGMMQNIEESRFIRLYDLLIRVDLIERINFIREDDNATEEREVQENITTEHQDRNRGW